MVVSIPNKKKLIQYFLNPITILSPICSVSVLKDRLRCISSSINSTVALSLEYGCTSEGECLISLPDVKRLKTALDATKSEDVVFDISENYLKYNDGIQKFKYHLLENDLVKRVTINIEKAKKLQYDTKFGVVESKLSSVYQGMSFTPDSTKVYIFTEDGKVKIEIGDRARDNTDNFVTTLSDTFEGAEIIKPIPVSIDTFNLISFDKNTVSEWAVNHQFNVFKVEINVETANLTYIFSALSN